MLQKRNPVKLLEPRLLVTSYGAALAFVLLTVGAFSAGCGGGASRTGGGDDFQAQLRLTTIASFYGDYLGAFGAPPKDQAAFRTFLNEREAGIKRLGVDSVDDLLTSPRDGQQIVVIYGKKVAPPDSPNTPWACYEQTGVDGKQMAAQVRGEVKELSADEIAKLAVGATAK
jgi:hypothetical protein